MTKLKLKFFPIWLRPFFIADWVEKKESSNRSRLSWKSLRESVMMGELGSRWESRWFLRFMRDVSFVWVMYYESTSRTTIAIGTTYICKFLPSIIKGQNNKIVLTFIGQKTNFHKNGYSTKMLQRKEDCLFKRMRWRVTCLFIS